MQGRIFQQKHKSKKRERERENYFSLYIYFQKKKIKSTKYKNISLKILINSNELIFKIAKIFPPDIFIRPNKNDSDLKFSNLGSNLSVRYL